MKLALLSDPHLTFTTPIGRTDDIALTMRGKMEQVGNELIARDIKHLLIAGDLTDVKRSWELLSYLTTLFREWKWKGITVYGILGQHDSYYHEVQNETTVLGILIKSGLVVRLTSKPITVGYSGDGFANLYGASYGEPAPKVKKSSLPDILVIHKMIAMRKMWSTQTNLNYAPDFLRKHGDYSLILCGDAHQQFIHTDRNDGRIICNTGPLLRLEASKEMMKHKPKIMIYDTAKNTIKWSIINGPNEPFTRDHIIKDVKQDREEFDAFVNEILEQGPSRYKFEHILRSYLKALDKKKESPNENVRKILSEVMADE